jgi:putative FmdB family regulatory protein
MPIYEYVCQACGHDLEALQKLSDAPLTECPKCGKPELKKMVSAAGFRLKGAGWYETDFKKGSDKKKNLVGGSDSGESKTPSKIETKTEAKAETKTEAKPVAKPAASSSDKS